MSKKKNKEDKKQTRIIILVRGVPREIFRIIEKNDGDVYISVKPTEFSDDEIPLRIIERRFTIHVSNDSLDYNVLKFHSLLEGVDEPRTTVSLTDAVKSPVNFGTIGVIKFPDLSASQYNVLADGLETIDFGAFDPTMQTLAVGIYVSHRDVRFSCISQVRNVQTQYFNIAFVFDFFPICATENSHIKVKKTFPPEKIDDEAGRAEMRGMMKGDSAQAGFDAYRQCGEDMYMDHIERLLPMMTIPAMKANWKGVLKGLRDKRAYLIALANQ